MTTEMVAVILGAASERTHHRTSARGSSRRQNARNIRCIWPIWAVAATMA
jgi:hypothetical protein